MSTDFDNEIPEEYFDADKRSLAEPVYCLKCEEWTYCGAEMNQHVQLLYGVDDIETLWCYGPFVNCPPPDNFEDEWDVDLVEPDGDELFIMNHCADLLLQELEG